ncbi:helicase Swr1p [[Candida] anglica]|uniref:Helicase SWR1 n=1 Tax=[Candida] anglica TaxID=148631 RepID=A0ABP0EBI4_9ASCO
MTTSNSRRSRRISAQELSGLEVPAYIDNAPPSSRNRNRSTRTAKTEEDEPVTPSHKKRKLNTASGPPQEVVANLMTKHSLLVNELFNLKEYKSVVYWDPAIYSKTTTPLPEIFEEFCKAPEYQLNWSENAEEEQRELISVPLRLQKKIIAERETKINKTYPFKPAAIEKSIELEEQYLRAIDSSTKGVSIETKVKSGSSNTSLKIEPIESKPSSTKVKQDRITSSKPNGESKQSSTIAPPSTKGNTKRSNNKAVSTIKEENETLEEHDPDVDTKVESSEEEEINTNYKIKEVKFSIPPPLVTHPSHIPSWIPSLDDNMNNNNNGNEKSDTILEFDTKPIQVHVNSKSHVLEQPEIQSKIQNFLQNRYKSAIVDESTLPDYNSTPEEYEAIMEQQETLVRKLYQKIHIERRLELNGEKIEPRKTFLPQTNAKTIIDPFRANDLIITAKSVQGTVPSATHQDILLSQGMAFSKLHQQARKQHQVRTRKVAQMIESYFKKKRGEKERLARERELNLKKISRLAVQAVKRRWVQASKVYRHLQQEEEEELKRIKGREHLSQMLEHSTQLLEAQLAKPAEEEKTGEEDASGGDSDGSSDSDDHLSSSSDEESEEEYESVAIGTTSGDENLTVEELRSKYKDLGETTTPISSRTNSGSDSDDDSDSDIDVNDGLSALYGGKSKTPEITGDTPISVEYTEEQKEMIESISKDDNISVLDSSDSSDMDESDDSSNDSSSDASESEAESKSVGLSSLFANGSVEDENSDADVDADVDVDMNSDSDDDNMSMTTDEDDEPKTPKTSDLSSIDEKGGEDIVEEEINGSKVRDVPIPSLLRGTLRPYQKQGLNWMASLYNNNTNGILADEMGLGKTIQTISLLSYLACEHQIWGPHLIVVPTSVMLNWEMEFKKFAPGFKVLTYYGSPQQRAAKRKGWNKPDAFHVCITSYQLVVHDHQSFKRRRWRYMILDEAHNIKNFRSTRWRALLNFNTENRLLLTGTPLQNNLMELWSLLYFLMPSSKVNQAMPDGFANLEDFQTWFGKPVDRILEQTSAGTANPDLIDESEKTTAKLDSETRNTVARLHQVLRPYLLRRLKKDVEKQMPGKYEHIVYCRLSKRQRYLYDDFMSRAKTKETLASGNFLSIINCLMQLRKVCNHPDLFEVRPIVTSFAMPHCVSTDYQEHEASIRRCLRDESFRNDISLNVLNLDITSSDNLNYFTSKSIELLKASKDLESQIKELDVLIEASSDFKQPKLNDHVEYYKFHKLRLQIEVQEKLKQILYLNNLRCSRQPLYGEQLLKKLKLDSGVLSDIYNDIVLSIDQRSELMSDTIEKFSVLTPAVVTLDMKDQIIPLSTQYKVMEEVSKQTIDNPFHKSQVKLSIAFPDKSLLQYDCGKLQKLASLLQELTAGGHRALIFTQMTKVLDILEQFLNIHGYRYMRLDGSTKIEDRQILTESFNRDNKIPVFILSTRSGGLGINLTGADTVIFYDSDWNPAMDKQCQDRCHRIGQSRDVHIYRFVSEYTIESNILRKANQKRQLDNVVIQDGEFTTDYFGKFSVKDLVGNADIEGVADKPIGAEIGNVDSVLAQAEDEDDRAAANAAMKEIQVDDEDFDEENKPTTTGGTPASTPGPTPTMSGTPAPVPEAHVNPDLADVDFEEGVGHVDEYMLRFIADGNYWD